jgi:hypothetical protein
MPIRRLLENSSSPPEEISRLVAAYELTLEVLSLKNRDDPITEMVARKVIEIGSNGGDELEISKVVLGQLLPVPAPTSPGPSPDASGS